MDELPLPQHGNLTTYNLENVLHANVSNSEYYKNILQDGIAHFGDLIDEIYNEARCMLLCRVMATHFIHTIMQWFLRHPTACVITHRPHKRSSFSLSQSLTHHPLPQVTNVEPWMSGNARGSSTAFCVLWKMFKMKPTPKQIRSLINHRDSPYIRAVRAMALCR